MDEKGVEVDYERWNAGLGAGLIYLGSTYFCSNKDDLHSCTSYKRNLTYIDVITRRTLIFTYTVSETGFPHTSVTVVAVDHQTELLSHFNCFYIK